MGYPVVTTLSFVTIIFLIVSILVSYASVVSDKRQLSIIGTTGSNTTGCIGLCNNNGFSCTTESLNAASLCSAVQITALIAILFSLITFFISFGVNLTKTYDFHKIEDSFGATKAFAFLTFVMTLVYICLATLGNPAAKISLATVPASGQTQAATTGDSLGYTQSLSYNVSAGLVTYDIGFYMSLLAVIASFIVFALSLTR